MCEDTASAAVETPGLQGGHGQTLEGLYHELGSESQKRGPEAIGEGAPWMQWRPLVFWGCQNCEINH